MISEFQRQSRRRKLIYTVLLLALFSATLLIRGDKAYLNQMAKAMGIREEDTGDVQLTDKALRLTLTGSRGLAVCGLWYTANEKQKKHEWNELELLIRSLIKLQPHFQTPWLFQSWNLAYNVSVECDRVRDKYFYIAQGIQLLAEGARQNKMNAEMRFGVGFYTQDKIGLADEQNTLRSLFQMSGIDPLERDPARFYHEESGRPVLDLDQFEQFCQRHPFLVRRLREHLRCNQPEKVVKFLEDNQKIPGRFAERAEAAGGSDQRGTPLLPVTERFPVLPGPQNYAPQELTYDSDLTDDIDNYAAARAWYGAAQDPRLAGKKRQHGMADVIFESYPARAQRYIGEKLEAEGWFDQTGWEIDDWFLRDRSRPQAGKRTVGLGKDRSWAMDAWERAYRMYLDFAESRRLNLSPGQMDQLSDRERKDYEHNRSLSNLTHHLGRTEVERTKKAVTARRYFHTADSYHSHANRDAALRTYERPEAIPTWRRLLLDNTLFSEDTDVQEDSYLVQRKYLDLIRQRRLTLYRNLLAFDGLLAMGTVQMPGAQCCLPARIAPQAYALRVPLHGPFDTERADKVPLILEQVRLAVIERYNLALEYDLPRPRQIVLPADWKAPMSQPHRVNIGNIAEP
jgi:hypothetical protein